MMTLGMHCRPFEGRHLVSSISPLFFLSEVLFYVNACALAID